MSKVKLTTKHPGIAIEGEYIIEMPDFLNEIKANERYEGRGSPKLTTQRLLRSILGTIAEKYNPEMDVLSGIAYSNYDGIAYVTHEDLSKIVLSIISIKFPKTIDMYILHKLKTRPTGLKRIYIISDNPKYLKYAVEMGLHEELADEEITDEKLRIKEPKTKEQVWATSAKSNVQKKGVYEKVSTDVNEMIKKINQEEKKDE